MNPKDPDGRNFSAGFWRLADPKITLASMASILLGVSCAARDHRVMWGWLTLTILGIFAIEVAKNASGEIFDFDSGTDVMVRVEDRSPFSGGKRVLVDGLLSRAETRYIAAAFYGVGCGIGLFIYLMRAHGVLWLGLFGVGCAYFYHAPPIKLSYRGLGELAVGIIYGPLICTGTYLVQVGSYSTTSLLVSIPLGLLVAAFLWINEFPDSRADSKSGKRTLVVRMGQRRAARVFCGMVTAAYVFLSFMPILGISKWVLLGLAGLAPGIWACIRSVTSFDVTRKLVPAQAATLAGFVLYALGAGIGMVVGQ